ncbi:MAG: allantoicase [Pyrinomonadaceae bacterium]
MNFTELVDLASERLGGAVVVANDEFFASSENLVKVKPPIFMPDEYTDRGKWMDGWETRRRRTPGFDWCIIRLGLPGIVRGVVVDTSYFRGNYPEQCAIEACAVDGQPDAEALTDKNIHWIPIVGQVPLAGDTQNSFPVKCDERLTHVRLRIFPDGGVARLRVYGEVKADWKQLMRLGQYIDLAAVENGGMVVTCSDMFFGHRHNLIMPGRASNMSDGWETQRRRGPGHDWVIIKLATVGLLDSVEVDTSYFKGNYPESCSLEGCDGIGLSEEQLTDLSLQWRNVLPRTKLQPHRRHGFAPELVDAGPFSHVRFNIFPDGGVSRLRIYGRSQDV